MNLAPGRPGRRRREGRPEVGGMGHFFPLLLCWEVPWGWLKVTASFLPFNTILILITPSPVVLNSLLHHRALLKLPCSYRAPVHGDHSTLPTAPSAARGLFSHQADPAGPNPQWRLVSAWSSFSSRVTDRIWFVPRKMLIFLLKQNWLLIQEWSLWKM